MPGHHVNGALTVGENIGDLGGLTIALLAYEISLAGEEPPVVDGLTGPTAASSRTGRSSGGSRPGRSWPSSCSRSTRTHRPSSAPTSCATSTSSTPRTRPHPGDGLWLDPADRVRIW